MEKPGKFTCPPHYVPPSHARRGGRKRDRVGDYITSTFGREGGKGKRRKKEPAASGKPKLAITFIPSFLALNFFQKKGKRKKEKRKKGREPLTERRQKKKGKREEKGGEGEGKKRV